MSRRGHNSYASHNIANLPPRPPHASTDSMYRFGGNPRSRGDFSFRSKISDRDLLRHVPTANATPVFGPGSVGDRFKNVENLTDSEEEAMDEGSDTETYRSKRRKLVDGAAETIPIARWSNPDPYTALPPGPESSGKHIDVVKLIRKARNDKAAGQNAMADEDDFISFDMAPDPVFAPPANAPLGPRADVQPAPPPYAVQSTSNSQAQHLGKRKRETEDTALMGNPSRGQFHANGQPLATWLASGTISAAPWLQSPKSADSPMVALHKEIIDFHAWVRPQDFEHIVREDLIRRLSRELNRYRQGELKPFGSYAAGLYLPTGDMDLVYNMRGVLMTRNKLYQIGDFITRNGLAAPRSMTVIHSAKVPIIKYVDALTGIKVDLSFNNDTGVIAIETFKKWQASYPALPIIVAVIKQFLMIRGLNDNAVGGFGGFATICMATSLIQNLPVPKNHNLGELLLEFFNLYGNLLDYRRIGIRMEPPAFINKVIGTPGAFKPSLSDPSREDVTDDLQNKYYALPDEKAERLMIIDPNRPDNNITGGSNQVARIVDLFSRTHSTMLDRLDEYAAGNFESGFSFLEKLIGGDFTAYYEHRKALYNVYRQSHPDSAIPPPPPPPVSQPVVKKPDALRPPLIAQAVIEIRTSKTKESDHEDELEPPSGNQGDINKKCKKRLNQVKKFYPELVAALGARQHLNIRDALKIGGWKSSNAMKTDLARRAQAQQNQMKPNQATKKKSKSKKKKTDNV